ncbi:MAG: hypothetical protein HRU70_01835 [Phycisphaeraceae bacterium]|nr:MAG: hypothetical protein HRU70_01835 [Phycisphaeraceae bacterium]
MTLAASVHADVTWAQQSDRPIEVIWHEAAIDQTLTMLVAPHGGFRFDACLPVRMGQDRPKVDCQKRIATRHAVYDFPYAQAEYEIIDRDTGRSGFDPWDVMILSAPWPRLAEIERMILDAPDAEVKAGPNGERSVLSVARELTLVFDADDRLRRAVYRPNGGATIGMEHLHEFGGFTPDDPYPSTYTMTSRHTSPKGERRESVLRYTRRELRVDPPDAASKLAFDPATTDLPRLLPGGDVVDAKGTKLYNKKELDARIMADLTGATERRWWVWGVVAGVLLLAGAGLVARQRARSAIASR